LITQINGAVCQRQEPCASVTVSLSDIKGRNPMAETTSMAGASKATNEAQEAMKKQIAELRREITKINRTLSDQAEEAQGWYDGAADRLARGPAIAQPGAHRV
jgi:hypothetical protein